MPHYIWWTVFYFLTRFLGGFLRCCCCSSLDIFNYQSNEMNIQLNAHLNLIMITISLFFLLFHSFVILTKSFVIPMWKAKNRKGHSKSRISIRWTRFNYLHCMNCIDSLFVKKIYLLSILLLFLPCCDECISFRSHVGGNYIVLSHLWSRFHWQINLYPIQTSWFVEFMLPTVIYICWTYKFTNDTIIFS